MHLFLAAMRRNRRVAIHWEKQPETALKTHLYLDQLPMSRPSKRLRMISLALAAAPEATAGHAKVCRHRSLGDAAIRTDLDLLLDSFLCDAINLDVLSPIDSMDDLPERHKAFALELEGRSVWWRAWNTSCGVWLIGGTLNASRPDRLGGAVIYLEWMNAKCGIHRNWWRSFKVGEWIAGPGR
jgi:hypothetical protein